MALIHSRTVCLIMQISYVLFKYLVLSLLHDTPDNVSVIKYNDKNPIQELSILKDKGKKEAPTGCQF